MFVLSQNKHALASLVESTIHAFRVSASSDRGLIDGSVILHGQGRLNAKLPRCPQRPSRIGQHSTGDEYEIRALIGDNFCGKLRGSDKPEGRSGDAGTLLYRLGERYLIARM